MTTNAYLIFGFSCLGGLRPPRGLGLGFSLGGLRPPRGLGLGLASATFGRLVFRFKPQILFLKIKDFDWSIFVTSGNKVTRAPPKLLDF